SDSGLLFFAILYPFLESALCTGLWTLALQTVNKSAFIGVALAVVVMGMDLGMVVGPPLFGYIIETLNWHAATVCFCICGLLCSLCIYFAKIYYSYDAKKN
ncbi:MAG: hypothetical protein RSB05_07490, partial [Clostridiales bacterium]